MSAPTTAARAAQARLRRRATPARAVAAATAAKDPCPTCGTELGQPHGASRRLVVLGGDRGVFHWQCPECRGSWSERASTQSGSTTRSTGATV